jgi:4-amino-4-deoxy-L-arabinose transferase-like glycosyltransferase
LEIVLVVGLLALALAPRLWCFGRNALPEGDAGNYLEVGRNLALGRGYTTYAKWDFYGEPGPVVHPEGNRQPMLPLLVAATWKLGATTPLPARAATLAASLAAVLLLYAVLRRWLGVGLALAGAAFVAVEPAFLWFAGRVQTESWFILLFLAALWTAGDFREERPSWLRPVAVGVLLSLAYLFRVNGVLLLVAYAAALVVVYRGRGVGYALLALAAFAAAAAPWWLRNARAFGDPFYSQAKYFVISANFDDAWAVKRYVPSWTSFFETYGVAGIAARYVRGVWRALEPLFLGNLHFNEPYQGAPLAAFLVFTFFIGPLLRARRALVFPALALALHVLAFALYGQALYRYFLPFYMLVIPLGVAGAWGVARGAFTKPRWLKYAVPALMIMAFIRPLGKTLAYDDRAEYKSLYAAATWIKEHTKPGEVVMTWPRCQGLLYYYDRPSVYWPWGPLDNVLWVLSAYDVKYVVVEGLLLDVRPELEKIWSAGPDGIWLTPPSERDKGRVIIRVDYGVDAFKEAFKADGFPVKVYGTDLEKIRRKVYNVYLEKG